ncbi:hypothetical protein BAU15_14345 [Enterococcus sp. JM4C]|uniref:DUF4129 domain-containing transglutaminase family protein n=1 Tax=Candidatus Enterococcus huntleyi TaxID=1857217 RepID=UPI00137A7B0A|nr:transglutaminase domain-containing protein [Enterococcus sp. JM4C]KAF1298858.1 hypothetical protein BAU15_14345 [Enterococcus sp. JM4C]
MRARIQTKFVLALTSYLAFVLAFHQFFEVYNIENQLAKFFGIGLISLTALLFPSKLVRFIFYSLSFFLNLMLLFPFSGGEFTSWLDSFVQQLRQISELFLNRGVGSQYTTVVVIILFVVTILLIELLVEYEQVGISIGMIVVYLLMLALYNEQEFDVAIILVLALGIFQKYYLSQGYGAEDEETRERNTIRKKNRKKNRNKTKDKSLNQSRDNLAAKSQSYGSEIENERGKLRMRGLVQVGVILLVLCVAAIFLPKTDLKAPILEHTANLRTFLQEKGLYQYIQQSGQQITLKTGFSENSEHLGGPISDDDQIVFEATQKSAHYWRVDSKAIYTGTGWIDSTVTEPTVIFPNYAAMDLPYPDYSGQLEDEETITLQFAQPTSYIPLPYAKMEVYKSAVDDQYTYQPEVRRLDSQTDSADNSVTMSVQNLSYTTDELAAFGNGNLNASTGSGYGATEYDEEYANQYGEEYDGEYDEEYAGESSDANNRLLYVQLPEYLPERVSQLAKELTEDQDTQIDRVLAIESYLKRSGNFRYSKLDAMYTKEGQDYVDQFLFESKVGYCDNFSSAMVILLRTLDIPTRWAKGFAPGTATTLEDGLLKYTVRNTDAHSWVEVYFDGYGWLPFEPTPSFVQPLEATNQETTPSETVPPQASSAETSESTTSSSSSTSAPEESTTTSDRATAGSTDNPVASNGWLIVALISLLLLLLGGLFYREHIYLVVVIVSAVSQEPLRIAYPYLLRRLARLIPRAEGQPLQEYAQLVESQIPALNQDFYMLTLDYERYLYSQEKATDSQLLLKQTAKGISHWKFQRLFRQFSKEK